MKREEAISTDSQSLKIIRHLAQGRTLTRLEALRRFGCINLPGRIFDLRGPRGGRWKIERCMISVGNGKRVAQYSLPKAKR
jgi:hypothetical protein